VIDGAEADAAAKRLSIENRPALVVAGRVLSSPATDVQVARFVEDALAVPRLLLQAETKPDKTAPGTIKPCPILYGELINHTADSLRPNRDMLVLMKAGYHHSTATIRYDLPEDTRCAIYDVWTLFTLGGVAEQNPLFEQARTGSTWKTVWRSPRTTMFLAEEMAESIGSTENLPGRQVRRDRGGRHGHAAEEPRCV